jgi:ribosomal protein S18 acetylase RimI-like enzyme
MLERIAAFSRSEVSCALELADLAVDDPDRSGYRALVAVEAGQILGYINFGETPLTDRTYDLYWVAADPAARGKGAGTTLVKAMEAELKAKGARLVRVETSSLTEYGPARAFYAKLKYDVATILKDFYHPGDDLVVLTKRLDRPSPSGAVAR